MTGSPIPTRWRDYARLPHLERTRPPPTAYLLGGAALATAALVTLAWPEVTSRFQGLVWVLALVPLFLWLYYRGSAGGAVAAATAMAVFSLVEVGATPLTGAAVDWWFYAGASLVLVAVAGGAVWSTEYRDRAWERAMREAFEDPVTGLPTRRFAEAFLEIQVGAAARGQSLSVALLEVDAFRERAGSPGSPTERRLLGAVGRVLRENVRAMNVVGRYGDGRFLAVLPHEARSGASVFADRVRAAVAGLADEIGRRITISAGVAAYGDGATDAATLVTRAEAALRRAVELDGDRVILYGRDAYRVGPVRPHFAPLEAAAARPVDPAAEFPRETAPGGSRTDDGEDQG